MIRYALLGIIVAGLCYATWWSGRQIPHAPECSGCGYAIGSDGYCEIHGTADSTACPMTEGD